MAEKVRDQMDRADEKSKTASFIDHELVNDLASAYRGKRMRDAIRDMEMADVPESIAEQVYDSVGQHADSVRGELHRLVEDRLARKVAVRFAGKPPSKSPRAPVKFRPRIKLKDYSDVTDPDSKGPFSDVTDDGVGDSVDITEVTEKESSQRVAERHMEAVIRKEKGEFCVRSPDNPDWNGGCYKSKGEAEKRLKQVEWFKRK